MKPTLKHPVKIACRFLATSLLFLAACQEAPKKETPPEGEQKEKVEPPKGIISLAESKSLYDNYTRNRAALIQKFEQEQKPEEKFEPARFTAFSFSEIKQYMDFIEQEAQGAGVDISSLRFYFANYPDKDRFPDGRKVVHPRQNSIFIVPTMEVDGQDYGFYIGADGKAKPIKDAESLKGKVNRAEAGFLPSLSLYAEQSLNLNHGTSGPPPHTDFQE